jgi:ABC-type dipeptide/oligopeptide/nickel transport system ATPase component
MNPVLRVRDLCITIGPRRVVDGVSLDLLPGRTTALVGESGSGKSMTALAAIGLLPPGAKIARGEILLGSRDADAPALDLARADEATRRSVRGREIAMVFQEPMTALNPVLTIGEQVGESVARAGVAKRDVPARVVAALREVGIHDAPQRLGQYPHEFSGGMRQRVLIAMALAAGPRVLLADEPTTALDAHVRARVLDLIDAAKRERGLGVLLITHDLLLARRYAAEVCVMYAGRVVERGDVGAVLRSPAHPYTRALLRCVPGERTFGRALTTVGAILDDPREFAPIGGRRPWWPGTVPGGTGGKAGSPPPTLVEHAPGHLVAVEGAPES